LRSIAEENGELESCTAAWNVETNLKILEREKREKKKKDDGV
jgi:hypothetical protein